MQDKKLSELPRISRTELEGIDLVPLLDLSENTVNNRNKVVPLDDLYLYVQKRFLDGGDVLYLLQGVNTTQTGYFNEIHVNKLSGNSLEAGAVIDIDADTTLRSANPIRVDELLGYSNATTGINFSNVGVISFKQNNVEVARLGTNQRILVGTTTSRSFASEYEPKVQLEVATPSLAAQSILSHGANELGPGLVLGKTRSETIGGNAAVQNHDQLGSIVFVGANGSNLSNAAAGIRCEVDGVPFAGGDSSSLPGRLIFQTTSLGSDSPVERMRLDSTGVLSFNQDLDTGIYSSDANTLDIKAGNVRVVSATPTGVSLYGQINLYGFEPYVTVLDSDPLTNNRTIYFPDVTGTVVVTNATGVVTSQMLADNTIVNADINTNADISVSKLKHGITRQLLQTNAGGTNVEWTSDIAIPGTLSVIGAATFNSAVNFLSTLTAPQFAPTGSSVPVNGFYYPGTNQLGFSTNSTLRFLIGATGQLQAVGAGTASTPNWTFATDTNTGIYNPAADILSFAAGGIEALRINSYGALGFGGNSFGSTAQIAMSAGSNSAPTWTTITGDIQIDANGVTAISNGSIVNADINATAGITDDKLNTISTTNKVAISALNINGSSEIGANLQDNDLFVVDDNSANARRSVLASRLTDYTFSKVSGDVSISIAGTASVRSSLPLTGTPTAPTAAADTNTTQLATTAFVLGQGASSVPLMDGAAAAGSSVRFARADHIHPSDTSKANVNSPALTGIPTAPTAGVDNNTTQLATTAFVINQNYLKTSTANITYAPLASPGLTGTPTAPTASTSSNSTQLATTEFVKNAIDSTFQGLRVQTQCRVATTENITLSGTQTIDGIAVNSGDRVLVKNQSTATQNGVYIVAAGAWNRATDFDSSTEIVSGSYFYIEDGNVNGATTWVLITSGTVVVGTTNLTFNKFSTADATAAGNGLVKVGTTMNVGTASNDRIVINADNIDLATTGVSANTYQSVTVDLYGRVTGGSNPTTVSGYGISDAAIVNQTMHIGTTAVAINRNSANLALTGISSIQLPGSVSGTLTLQPPANPSHTITFPAVNGTVITTGDSGTITGTIIAADTISNSNIASNAAIGFSKLQALPSAQILVGNASNVATPVALSGAVTINNSGNVSLANDVIVNANINTNAAIADTKLATISTSGKVANSATTATTANTPNTIVLRDGSGNFTAGTITATSFSGSGTGLTGLTAAQLSGTIPSSVLSNSSFHVGTTQIALNRNSGNQALTGIQSISLPGSTSGAILIQPTAIAGTNTITLPATTGTVVTTGDSGTVTSTMIQNGTIINDDINNSAGIAFSKLQSLSSANILIGSGTNVPTGTAVTGAISITNAGVVSITAGAISNTSINAAAAIDGTKINPNFGSQNITTSGNLSITSSGKILAAYGTAANPSLAAASDTNTGLLWESGNDDKLFIVSGGNKITYFDSSFLYNFKSICISTDNDSSATIGTPTVNSRDLRLSGRYYANGTSNVGEWRLANDIVSVTPTSNLNFQWVTPTGGTSLITFNQDGQIAARSFNVNTVTATAPANGIYSPSTDTLVFTNNSSESLRLTSGGSIVAGHTSSILTHFTTESFTPTQGPKLSLLATQPGGASQGLALYSTSNVSKHGTSYFRSRATTIGSSAAVQLNDILGAIDWNGDDGNSFSAGASIMARVDGTVIDGAVPSRLVAYTTLADGTTEVPRENWRVTHDAVMCRRQSAPTAVNATDTLTVDNLKVGIITSTTAAAVTMTLPTGTLTEAGFNDVYTNLSFDWFVINTGSTNSVTIQDGSGHTVVGNRVVTAGTSGHFRSRRTTTNTFTAYRLS